MFAQNSKDEIHVFAAIAKILLESRTSQKKMQYFGAIAWIVLAGLILGLSLVMGDQSTHRVQKILVVLSAIVAFMGIITLISGLLRNRRLNAIFHILENEPEKVNKIEVTRKTFHTIPVFRVKVMAERKLNETFTVSEPQAKKIKVLLSERRSLKDKK